LIIPEASGRLAPDDSSRLLTQLFTLEIPLQSVEEEAIMWYTEPGHGSAPGEVIYEAKIDSPEEHL
jgi:hypothetical protein